MTTESDTKPVMDYIKASLPLLSADELAETAEAVLKEARKRNA